MSIVYKVLLKIKPLDQPSEFDSAFNFSLSRKFSLKKPVKVLMKLL